jgi:pimeloyl-ACP methyl ester carboxylesterase
VVLVGYSLGGVVIRAWFDQADAADAARVDAVVTLASPFGGVVVSPQPQWSDQRTCSPTTTCGDLRPGSAYLRHLAERALPPTRWMQLLSAHDQLVDSRTAMLRGARNVVVENVCAEVRLGHLAMRESPQVLAFVRAVIEGRDPVRALAATC